MKTKILLNIIIGLISINCFAQSKRVENEFMECTYKSYADNGKSFKELISNYEKLLIKENILKNSSGKSYRQIYQKIADGKEFKNIPSTFFSQELQKIDQPDLDKFQECQNILAQDSSDYDMSKVQGWEQIISSVSESGDLEISLIGDHILKLLSEKDFELNFYKIRTFFLFSVIDIFSGSSRDFEKN